MNDLLVQLHAKVYATQSPNAANAADADGRSMKRTTAKGKTKRKGKRRGKSKSKSKSKDDSRTSIYRRTDNPDSPRQHTNPHQPQEQTVQTKKI